MTKINRHHEVGGLGTSDWLSLECRRRRFRIPFSFSFGGGDLRGVGG